MVYRILLIGGPEDGDYTIAPKPYYCITTNGGNVYVAEQDENGDPIMEEGDAGEGIVMAVTMEGGDTYSPPVNTIRMTFSHKLTGEELDEWEALKKKYLPPL